MRRIEIAVGQHQLRRWHLSLADRLTRLDGVAEVRFRVVSAGVPWRPGVQLLLETERQLVRRTGSALCDVLSPNDVSMLECRGPAPQVIVDLTGAAPPSSGAARVLQPRYDGSLSEEHMIGRLLNHRAPVISIDDVGNSTTLTGGLPSLEASMGLTGKLESVFSRVITLIECAVAHPQLSPPPACQLPSPVSTSSPASFVVRGLANQGARIIQNAVARMVHWRIGWRWVDGSGAVDTGSLFGPSWHALDDVGDAFAADPFPVEWQGRFCVFFERFDHVAHKGTIWVQELGADGPLGPPQQVLEERWHLSYPQPIEHEGTLYMLPEAARSGSVSLYRCVEFPHRWERAAVLLEGITAADSTVFHHAGRYWMTSVIRPSTGGYSDTLVIHHAPDLLGPWEQHAQSPVLIDARCARPAGSIVERGGVLYRPVQDCSDGYGRRISIMRIDTLDERRFEQTQVGVLTPGPQWPGTHLHTVNRWGRLECIDGAVTVPRSRALRNVTERLGWNRPRA